MAERISIGIDIGTHNIKVVVTESRAEDHKNRPKIIGSGLSESKGLRHGYIVDASEAIKSIKQAVNQAEKSSGYKISKAYLAIGGAGLGSGVFSSTIMLPDKESEITENEIKRVLESAEAELGESFTLNKEILHVIPLQYKIDGKVVLGKAQGMRGGKLEAKVLFITALSQHIDDFVDTIGLCGIEIEDVMASPLAGSLLILNKQQQMAGCILVNIGSETLSATVFENGVPASLEVFPIGSVDITNDIALGLKISLEDAERVKLSKPESVPYPRKKLEEIIGARLSDMFDLIESHLKKIGRNGLLPAGIIITGGGSYALNIEELAKNYLKLPAKRAIIKFDSDSKLPQNQKEGIKENIWTIAYGLCILGSNSTENITAVNNLGLRWVKTTGMNLWKWIKKILP